MKFLTALVFAVLAGITAAAGATITGPLTQANLSAAANGELDVSAGTYTFTSPLTIPSGITLSGAAGFASHVVFNLPASTPYGFIVAGGDSNVTVKNLDLHSNAGVFKMMDGSGYSNITITNNYIQIGGGSYNGNIVAGIYESSGANGLNITHNHWHDSTASNRSWVLFTLTNSHCDYNLYTNVQDGGQQYPGNGCTFDYNYATGLCNKLQEGSISGAQNFEAKGNVAYNWQSTNASSMGLSLLANGSGVQPTGWTATFASNYINLSLPGNNPGGTSGVVYEVGGGPLQLTNNIGGGASAPGIFQTNTPASTGSGNQAFGPHTWGSGYCTEGGSSGGGSWVSTPGTYDANLADIPAPPANTFAGTTADITVTPVTPPTPPTPTANPPVTNAAPTLVHTIQVFSDGSIKTN